MSTFPGLIGVKTGHTNGAGWSQVAAARGGGVTIYATMLGGATREGRNADLAGLLAWGLARYRTVWAIDGGTDVRHGADRLREARGASSSPPSRRCASSAWSGRSSSASSSPWRRSCPCAKGQRLGEVQVFDRGTVIASSPLVAANAVERRERSDA